MNRSVLPLRPPRGERAGVRWASGHLVCRPRFMGSFNLLMHANWGHELALSEEPSPPAPLPSDGRGWPPGRVRVRFMGREFSQAALLALNPCTREGPSPSAPLPSGYVFSR